MTVIREPVPNTEENRFARTRAEYWANQWWISEMIQLVGWCDFSWFDGE